MSKRKVIVTIAPTGGMAHKSQNPHLPTQPAEIAADVVRLLATPAPAWSPCTPAGPTTARPATPTVYRDINSRIRAAGCDIVLNNSTGGGVHGDMVKPLPGDRWEIAFEERIKGMDAGAEMCTLDATTLNLSFEGREILMDTPLTKGRAAGRRHEGARHQARVGGVQPDPHPAGHDHADPGRAGRRALLHQPGDERAPQLPERDALLAAHPADDGRHAAQGRDLRRQRHRPVAAARPTSRRCCWAAMRAWGWRTTSTTATASWPPTCS